MSEELERFPRTARAIVAGFILMWLILTGLKLERIASALERAHPAQEESK